MVLVGLEPKHARPIYHFTVFLKFSVSHLRVFSASRRVSRHGLLVVFQFSCMLALLPAMGLSASARRGGRYM